MEEWQEQLRESAVSLDDLRRRGFRVPAGEASFPMRITPHVLALMDKDTEHCPIGRQFVPHPKEHVCRPAEMEDAIAEESHTRHRTLIHAYPDRAFLFACPACATYCRYCTRKRKVGRADAQRSEEYEAAFAYLRTHPEITDVLLSGGDALLLTDKRIEYFLAHLAAIPSVRTVRLASRVLSSLPQRITPALASLLERYRLHAVQTQINHPREITPQTQQAVSRLRKAGIEVRNQTVLLKSVNDTTDAMRTLCRELYAIGIRPYYIYHCDLTLGNAYLRTSIETGREVYRTLQGWIPGPAVPRYIFDCPRIRKVPINGDYLARLPNGDYEFTNYRNETWTYHEADALEVESPAGAAAE